LQWAENAPLIAGQLITIEAIAYRGPINEGVGVAVLAVAR